jgi:hypothetical protein
VGNELRGVDAMDDMYRLRPFQAGDVHYNSPDRSHMCFCMCSCVCMCVCICVCVCKYAYVCHGHGSFIKTTNRNAEDLICIYACVCKCVCICCLFVCLLVCLFVCLLYVCIYVYQICGGHGLIYACMYK